MGRRGGGWGENWSYLPENHVWVRDIGVVGQEGDDGVGVGGGDGGEEGGGVEGTGVEEVG